MLSLGIGRRDKWPQASPEALVSLLDELLDVESAATDQQPGGPRVQRYTRSNVQFNPTRYALRRSLLSPHKGSTLRSLLATDFALPDMDISPHRFWTSADQFLAHSGGWCLERDGQLASMAFSSFRFDHQLEIGAETRANYLGQRNAFYVACASIDQCISQGLEPVWSCRKENKGSYKLALALGFEPTIEVPYYGLPGAIQRFSPSDSSFMINYRVDNLDEMLAQLHAAGVAVIAGPESHENGMFAWIMDPDGNKVELWEPMLWTVPVGGHGLVASAA